MGSVRQYKQAIPVSIKEDQIITQLEESSGKS
jgi:uncharacterized protein YktA (UPF0223 family)